MLFAIRLQSRYTGELIFLGTKYRSEKAAEAAAKKTVCLRCNSYSVYPIRDDANWIDRRIGFRVDSKGANGKRVSPI